jgi:hypothetical protein
MENYNNIKYLAIAIIALLIAISSSKGQSTYQKYDDVTRGAEYHLAKSQIESNKKYIELLQEQKRNLSLKNESQMRSRIQAVVSAKTDENFRLGQKAFLIMDANKIENVAEVNAAFQRLRPKLESTR